MTSSLWAGTGRFARTVGGRRGTLDTYSHLGIGINLEGRKITKTKRGRAKNSRCLSGSRRIWSQESDFAVVCGNFVCRMYGTIGVVWMRR